MAKHDDETVRRVAWSEMFPWLRIVRTFRLAISARALVLGAAGAVVMAMGWWLLAAVLCASPTKSDATGWLQPYARCPWKAITEHALPDAPGIPKPAGRYLDELTASESTDAGWFPHDAVASPVRLLTKPARAALTSGELTGRDLTCLILCGLWGTAVWALFGAAICRTAAVQLAADEQTGFGAAMRFAQRKWPAYCAAALLPVLGVLLTGIPIVIVGWLMHWLGLVIGGILWPLVLLAGFVIALLLIGSLFGWPLMWGAISTEGTDSFDAMSRAYAYTFQRPLNYLFYAAVAAVVGWLGWLLVQNFAAAVVWLSYWAAAWGYGEKVTGSGFGVGLIHFWVGCVKLLAIGYLFSYFWSASAAIYLLLRRDVDATETDEVFLDADQSEPSATLPTIGTDSAGAPVIEPAQDAPPSEKI
ncbi:MAG: hypothetical protein ABFC63_12345 [Thermoguttaceae bacterium]